MSSPGTVTLIHFAGSTLVAQNSGGGRRANFHAPPKFVMGNGTPATSVGMGTSAGRGHTELAGASLADALWAPRGASGELFSTAKTFRSLNVKAEKMVEVPNDLTNFRRVIRAHLYDDGAFFEA
jgi:hypothetical protein